MWWERFVFKINCDGRWKVDTVQECGMEEIIGQVKWTLTSHTTDQFSPREGDIVYMEDWKGVLCYELLLENQAINSNKYCSQLLLLLSRFSRVQPHRRQPTRLPHPWNSPGRNTGVGCHCLLPVRPAESSTRPTASRISQQRARAPSSG